VGKKNRNDANDTQENEKRQRLEFEGVVIDANKGKFRVKVSDDYTVLCTLSGKIRTNSVKILLGDTVRIEAGEYDPSQGRIVYRIKAG
jgi:translation initiation factor IF-1